MDRTKPKGPDFLIIDNFAETFELEKTDLMNARREAEDIKKSACKNQIAGAYARCDYLVWLNNFDSQGDNLPAFRKIYQQMKALKPILNEISQDK